MIKKLSVYILLLVFVPSFGQDTNFTQPNYRTGILTIRKNIYDTIFYPKYTIIQTVDTIRTNPFALNGFGRVQRSFENSRRGEGYYYNSYNHWFFTPTDIYVYSKKISRWNRRMAIKNSEKFFRKMERKVKRGRLKYHKIGYTYELIHCLNNFQRIKVEMSCLIHKQTRDTVFSAVFGDTINEEIWSNNITYSVFITKFDTVSYVYDSTDKNRRLYSINSLYKYETRLNNNAAFDINTHFRKTNIEGAFFCSKSIDKKRYTLILNPENKLTRKLVFLENKGNRTLCDYKIENDSIFIINPPFPGFVAGKLIKRRRKGGFNKSKERIRFRFDRKTYTFKHKTFGNYLYDKMY